MVLESRSKKEGKRIGLKRSLMDVREVSKAERKEMYSGDFYRPAVGGAAGRGGKETGPDSGPGREGHAPRGGCVTNMGRVGGEQGQCYSW